MIAVFAMFGMAAHERRASTCVNVSAGARARLLPPLLLVPLLLGASACGLNRGVKDVKAIPASDVKFAIEAPCTVSAAQAAVERAAEALDLSVEEASRGPGDPWVFHRGPRLVDPPLYYRVDILPVADRQRAAEVRVYAIPSPRLFVDTQETIAKPGALAMRIVAACAQEGPQ